MAKSIKNRKKSGIEIHHIIEKRFGKLDLKPRDYPSVPISKELHRKITNRWRKVQPYERGKKKYKNLTKKKLLQDARIVYHDMPELRKIATEINHKYYK